MPDPQKFSHLTVEEFRLAAVSHIFRSSEALRWHLRQHRDEYIQAGALVYPSGRPMVVPEKFEPVFATIGQRNAQRRLTHRGE